MPRIDNSDDVIDSRDVIARIEQLSALREPGPVEGLDPEDEDTDQDSLFRELDALERLAAQGADYSEDWEHGATLIRDSYFKAYAQELAEDIGALPKTDQWPAYCIDWDFAARELQHDYSSIEFDGVTYWIR